MKKPIRRTLFCQRDGAIVPLFAFLLPVLLILAAFAVNISHQQLTATELRIATDVASHAGGRSLNVYQGAENPTPDMVISKLKQTVDQYYIENEVDGQQLTVPGNFSDYIEFYKLGVGDQRIDASTYSNSQNLVSEQEARGGETFNGVGVMANINIPTVFNFSSGGATAPGAYFRPYRNSVTKQIERDLAIVIDKSGSMLAYKDVPEMDSVLLDMRNQNYLTDAQYEIAMGTRYSLYANDGNPLFYPYSKSIYYPRYRVNFSHYQFTGNGYQWRGGFNVISKMRQFRDANSGDQRDLNAMIQYMLSWEGRGSYSGNRKSDFHSGNWINSGMFNNHAPAESRWDYLYRGIQSFVEVLEATPAEEKISLVVFDQDAESKHSLTSDYDAILEQVGEIIPNKGTAIHDGMKEGLTKVLEAGVTRPFAEKIVVVMTDGENSDQNKLNEPVYEAQRIVNEHPELTIHTLTFGAGAGTTPVYNPSAQQMEWSGVMVDVAEVGKGQHFHADEAEALRGKLKEIANIQPTIFTY